MVYIHFSSACSLSHPKFMPSFMDMSARTRVRSIDDTVKDELLLATLGYKQEFKRDFGFFEVFGIAFAVLALVPGISAVLVYAVPNGGPSAMVWGWAASSVFLMLIALSMAELGSAMPTAGGLYYWTYNYSSPRWRQLLSWLVGYINCTAYISGLTGIDWGCAVQIMAIVSIGSDTTFMPTTAQTFGVYCALLVCHGITGSLRTKDLALLQRLYVAANVGLCLAIIIGMPAATPSDFRNSASFAFGSFPNLDSWPNGFAFILSLLSPLWVIGGFDSTVHISEEARNANVAVPWAMVTSTFLGCILGWVINVVLVLNMGNDVVSILSSPIGQPMATILLNSFGKKGTLAIWSFVIAAQFMCGMSLITVSSRQNFAFARDGALPGSRFLYRVNKYTGTPVRSVWTTVTLAALLGLLVFAGPAAAGAIFTLGIIAQYLSNSIPITARITSGTAIIWRLKARWSLSV